MEKKRITFIDILIILAVIVVGIVGVTVLKGGSAAKTKRITYTVLVVDQHPDVAGNMKPTENILLDSASNTYGDVIDVDIRPAKASYFNNKTGEYVQTEINERKDVYVTVSVDATDNEWGYDIGETHIRVGSSQIISGHGFAVSGYIVDVQEG